MDQIAPPEYFNFTENVTNVSQQLIEYYISHIFADNSDSDNSKLQIQRLCQDLETFKLENICKTANLSKFFPSLFQSITTAELFSYVSADPIDPTGEKTLAPDHTIISYDLSQSQTKDCMDKNKPIAPYLFLIFHFLGQYCMHAEFKEISIRHHGAFVALIHNRYWNNISEFSTYIEIHDIHRLIIESITKLLFTPPVSEPEQFCIIF